MEKTVRIAREAAQSTPGTAAKTNKAPKRETDKDMTDNSPVRILVPIKHTKGKKHPAIYMVNPETATAGEPGGCDNFRRLSGEAAETFDTPNKHQPLEVSTVKTSDVKYNLIEANPNCPDRTPIPITLDLPEEEQ